MSAMQWCSRVGELFATAWSGPAARLSRRPRPCRASLCPCEWTVDREAGRCGTETPALYVTRAHKKLPIKQGQMWTSPSLTRSTQEWQMYPLGSWKLLTVKSNESSDHINTLCQKSTNWSWFISAIHLKFVNHQITLCCECFYWLRKRHVSV